MKLTKTQYKKLEGLMPIARKPAKISNYEFMCAMLYIIENGCKWKYWQKNIESIYSKNNNYLLVDRAYEDDKTLALAKNHGFKTVVPPKKNRKLPWRYDRHLYKHRNIIERYFLRLKRFRKVFTRYDKLDFIFISTISIAFIFPLLFLCERCLVQTKFVKIFKLHIDK